MGASVLAPTLGRTCALIATTLLGGACSTSLGSPPPPPPPAVGDAIMDWTIAGAKDPAACQQSNATTFHVLLYDSGGGFAGEYVQDCTTFATTIEGLDADKYTAQANLLDEHGQARTTTVNLAPFSVLGGATADVTLDFPSDSFY
jgi:hypothetical protein